MMLQTIVEQSDVNITYLQCVDNKTIYGTTSRLAPYVSAFRPSNYIPNHQEVAAKPKPINSIKLVLNTIPY
jgi:hypothetical protein